MAARPPDMRDWYTRQGLQVKGGGITLQAGGAIKGGQTAYNTGTGFFMGYSGGAYKFSLGNPSGNHIKWDGSTLTISGGVSVSYAEITGTKPPTNADNTTTAINATTTITGGGITLSGGGNIKGGQTDYATGTGFFLGYSGGAYKFSIGDTSNYLRWTGSALTLVGDISGASNISISGTANFTGNTTGVYGNSAVYAHLNTASGVGVLGIAGSGVNAKGVHGYAPSDGVGVTGVSSTGHGGNFSTGGASAYGVFASNTGGGTAIYSNGPLHIQGTMSISSTTKVTNLNADLLDGYTTGNSSGQIPLSNGTVCTNLNADLLDGNSSAAFAIAGHNHSGVYQPVGNYVTDGTATTYALYGAQTAGTGVATFDGTTKPGGSTTNVWIKIIVNGTTYYIPVWT